MMANKRPVDLHRHLPSKAFVGLLLLLLAALAALFVYTGIYNIGADAPHWRGVYMALEQLRERAVAHHSRNIAVPADLNSTKRIEAGAGLYNEMCTGCHLSPGAEKTDLAQGLYPQAPELARGPGRPPAQQFWIIKHGVKLSAMPAWGKTHNDQLIWDMVAFLQKLPKLSPEQYKAVVASAPSDEEAMEAEMPEMKKMMNGKNMMEGRTEGQAPSPAHER